MKVKPPFIGFPSPNVALGVWHLFARLGEKFQSIAFLTIGPNRWNEPRGSFAVQRGYDRYEEQDLERWSTFSVQGDAP